MARKRKAAAPKDDGTEPTRHVMFHGGPRHGDRMIVGTNMMQRYVRLALPEWATYRWDSREALYVYEGSEPPPKRPPAGPVRQDASALPVYDVDTSYRDSEAWIRGRREAQETMDAAAAALAELEAATK